MNTLRKVNEGIYEHAEIRWNREERTEEGKEGGKDEMVGGMDGGGEEVRVEEDPQKAMERWYREQDR